MIKIILAVIAGFFCFLGFISMLSAACVKFYEGGACEIILIPVFGHVEDIEFRIRGAVVRRRKSWRRAPNIIIADLGADKETAEIAKKLCCEYDGIEWVEYGALTDELRKIRQELKK